MLDVHLIITLLISIILFAIVVPYVTGTKRSKYIDKLNNILDGEMFEQ